MSLLLELRLFLGIIWPYLLLLFFFGYYIQLFKLVFILSTFFCFLFFNLFFLMSNYIVSFLFFFHEDYYLSLILSDYIFFFLSLFFVFFFLILLWFLQIQIQQYIRVWRNSFSQSFYLKKDCHFCYSKRVSTIRFFIRMVMFLDKHWFYYAAKLKDLTPHSTSMLLAMIKKLTITIMI